jgi:hypothetical protein
MIRMMMMCIRRLGSSTSTMSSRGFINDISCQRGVDAVRSIRPDLSTARHGGFIIRGGGGGDGDVIIVGIVDHGSSRVRHRAAATGNHEACNQRQSTTTCHALFFVNK